MTLRKTKSNEQTEQTSPTHPNSSKTHTKQRLELAALRCKEVDRVNYKMLKRILLLNLEQAEQVDELTKIVEHSNIRGPQAYQ